MKSLKKIPSVYSVNTGIVILLRSIGDLSPKNPKIASGRQTMVTYFTCTKQTLKIYALSASILKLELTSYLDLISVITCVFV
jgi:hypothetical protein